MTWLYLKSNLFIISRYIYFLINPSHPDPGRREKKKPLIFIFTLLCGVSKGLMKTLKPFTKLSEEQQRSVKKN